MKRFALLLVVLLAFAGMASAQMMYGVGAGVIIDTENVTVNDDGFSDIFSAIAVNLFFASSSQGLNFFADLDAGYMISLQEAEIIDGDKGDYQDYTASLAFYDTALQLSALLGVGYSMDMGMMALHFGAGVHLGLWGLSNDYGDVSALNLGAGGIVNAIFNLGAFKLRVGCQVAYDFLPLANDVVDGAGSDAVYSGLTIAPTVGIVF